ncbi:MAG: aspartate carbamoyltransferase regulatory subunit [Acidilobaceae archaeon]
MEEKKELLVRKIRDGIVIDHITAGRALQVLKLLGLENSGLTMAIVMNVESKKLNKKDIVKVEGFYLDVDQVSKISLVAPKATINVIKNWHVVEKKRVEPPQVVEGILKCPNSTCISRKEGEPATPKFRLVSREPLRYQCVYCDTIMREEEIAKYISG